MKRIFIFLFCGFITAVSCGRQKRTDIHVVFDRVDNIAEGAEVKMNGYPIGEVASMKLLDSGILVSIHLREKVNIPTGSEFTVTYPFIGDSYITIEPSSSRVYLTNKDTASGKYREEKILDRVMSDSLQKKKIQEALDKINEGIKLLIEIKKDSARQ